MRITKFINNYDYEYINCEIREKVKYDDYWTWDKVKKDWYSYNKHLYLSEYEHFYNL